MKKRRLLYISLVLLLAGCSNEENFSDTLSGNGKKTPLLINATLDTGKGLTRASGNKFVSGDELLTYVRHVKGGNDINNYTYVSDTPNDGYNKLVTYTKGNAAMGGDEADNVRETSDLTSTAYWDDFSNSSSADTYLRTGGHGLQSYYGYCYNGGLPNSLIEASGDLTWTVETNQSTAVDVQHSDLLWSPTQEKVAYFHESSHDANHGTLTIPYKHAMSEITVTVKTRDGFVGSTDGTKKPLDNTTLTLFKMGTVTTLTAPTSTWTPVPGEGNNNITSITMCGGPYSDYLTTNNFMDRNYTAIIAPGTKLKEGEKILEIINADGNNYSVTITSDMLNDATGWGLYHPAPKQGTEDVDKKYVLTQPGYNYHLTVTIDKASLQTNATLNNWTDVTASGIGDILLNDDDTNLIMDDSDVPYGDTNVKVVAVDKNRFKSDDSAASFTLFTLLSTPSNGEASARTNESYNFATVSTYKDNGGDNNDEWVNSPEIYWPNVTDNYYFRALASFNSSNIVAGITVNDIANVGTNKATAVAVSQGTIGENKDILWGTTASHRGYNNTHYVRGQAIPPRIGGVPIFFSHAMSKVSFTLETTSVDATKVDLANATFVVSNLYTSGTITIENGVINGSGERAASAISTNVASEFTGTSTNLITDLIVVPQTFPENAYVTVTLSNGAVYRVALRDCTLSDDNTATAWERGKNYSYTIHVEKEKVKFNAGVKDWDEVTGSGNAALEW